MLSPSGRLLASGNALRPGEALALMDRGLNAWKVLPWAARELDPRARGTQVARWEDSFPEAGLALRITLRELPANGDPSSDRRPPANRNHAWFSRDDARAFLPEQLAAGERGTLPHELFARLACLHLVDAVHGQGLPFAPEELEAGELSSKILENEAGRLRVSFDGFVRMVAKGPWLLGANDWVPNAEYPRSIALKLAGTASYDTATERFTSFELIAVGHRRGRTQFNGRSGPDDAGEMGFVFELVREGPSSKVSPSFVDLYRKFGATWVTDI